SASAVLALGLWPWERRAPPNSPITTTPQTTQQKKAAQAAPNSTQHLRQNYRRFRTAAASSNDTSAARAPTSVHDNPAATLATATARLTSQPCKIPYTNAPTNTSPEPVTSTTSTSCAGSRNIVSLSRVIATQPSSPIVTTTVCGPRSSNAR